jgi:aminoglycoside phosphotransferase (APT) family kinase protein
VNLDLLGIPLAPMTRVPGKASNRVYRLDTDQGSFAVKELDTDRGWEYRFDDVFRLETAAFKAGIPMPEPISATATTVVHRWVEGDPLPEGPVPRAFAFEVGQILANLHSLIVDWIDGPATNPEQRDWAELADRAAATGQPWAEELATNVATFEAIAVYVNESEPPGPVVLTHRDVQPWNLLNRAGHPVVLDWEISGRMEVSSELASTALGLAKGSTFEDVDAAVLRAVLDGYVEGGGSLPRLGPDWFAYMIGGWLDFTRRNIVRCVSGRPSPTGVELELCHDEVRNGLRGLPDMFSQIPRLGDLLTAG